VLALEVRGHLIGQLAVVQALVFFEFVFGQHELPARLVELRGQELVGAVGENLAVAQAFVDEQRGQPLGDPLGHARVVGRVTDAERVAFDDADADVLGPHPLDNVFHQLLVGPFTRIQVEVRDDLLEARAAENLLADRLQAILDARRHRRLDVTLRHALRHHEDQALRTVQVRQIVNDHRSGRCDQHRRQDDQPLPSPGHFQQRVEGVLLIRDHEAPSLY
jgi:hypothetical protein